MSSLVLSFPAEILEGIFVYLPLKDLLSASQVCHRWNKVLQSPLFQRQVLVKLHSDFKDHLTKADETFLSRAKNLSVVQKFDEDGAEDDNGSQVVPSEVEENIRAILFDACSELESLQLISRFQCVKSVIGGRLDELSNLRELSLSFAYQGEEKCDEPQEDLWLMRSNSLQSIQIGLANSLGPLSLDAPNLKEMHLTVNCKVLLDLVDKFSGQLKKLRLKLINSETLDEVLKMKFSKLNQLELAIFDHKDWEFSHVTVREEDDELVKLFVQEMSALESLSIRSDEVFYRLCPALCSMQTNLQQLDLHNLNVDSNILINILLIQNIKSLSVHHCEIVNEIPGLHIRLVNLLHLKLTNVVNNVLLNHNFSGLKSLQLLHNRFGNESLQKVFQNFPSIEQLQITFRAKLDEDAFQRLHQLKSLKSLTLYRTDTTAEHWNRLQPSPSVQQLTFEGCFMMPFSIFPVLGRVFPGLRRLLVVKCCVLDDTSSADAVVDGACERKLREMFGGTTTVSWHETMQVTPENLKKMLL